MARKKNREPNQYQVRLKLQGRDAQKFYVIKERFGLKTNAEVVRFLINEEYRRITKA